MAHEGQDQLAQSLDKVLEHTRRVFTNKPKDALPQPEVVHQRAEQLHQHLPENGLPIDVVTDHLLSLTDGFSNSSLSSTYYGFVTGGVTPYARHADILTAVYDQSSQVHLPDQSIVTHVEDRSLAMLLDLIRFDPKEWTGRVITTGATAGNIQGLACGRERLLQTRLGGQSGSGVARLGLLEACKQAGVEQIKILSTSPHSSLGKAASIVGLGRDSCIELGYKTGQIPQLAFDLEKLEEELSVPGRASIVVVSCGEVNTGGHATRSHAEMLSLRKLCDKYRAWLHVDGAFGIFLRLLQDAGSEYKQIASGTEGVELADSLAGDLHKFLNVPYDCGFYACRHPDIQKEVYQNANAAYLTAAPGNIPSPLNLGAENSRRFRGFAVYSTLIGLGRSGYVRILRSQVDLARSVARLINKMPALQLLNSSSSSDNDLHEDIATIVLFSAKDDQLNSRLAHAINSRLSIFVSGTTWHGRSACRIAVSNWQADKNEDFDTIRATLEAATHSH